jgi:lysophospholipase L1-like esterase
VPQVVSAPPSTPRWSGLLLTAGAVLATAGLLEAAFRLAAHFENRGLLGASVDTAPLPAPGTRATLGQMIRRTRNPRLVYELKPGLDVVFAGARTTTDGTGSRTIAGKPADPSARRIVGIGDSYMFGQGVADGETYLSVLQRRLAPAGPWSVVNLAVPGYNTAMEVASLEEKALATPPRIVVIEVVGNDMDLPNFIREPARVWAYDRSFLAAFVAGRVRRLRRAPVSLESDGLRDAPEAAAGPVAHFEDDPARVPPEYADMVGWPAFERSLRELARLRDAHGFAVVVLSQSPGFDWFDRRSRRLCVQLGLPFLDVGRAVRRYVSDHGFPDYLRSPLAVSPDDPHPSAQGHELAAAELHRFLEEQGMLR